MSLKKNIRCFSRSILATLILVISDSLSTYASDIISVLPVTDKILLVYLEDGHVDTHGSGETVQDNVSYSSPLVVANAMNVANYLITSTNDANYTSAQNPINIGRKSKGIDFVNTSAPNLVILGHWIYIELPTPMVEGSTYSLAMTDIVENSQKNTFTFQVANIRSETIHVNQVAFAESSKKYAYLSQWMGTFNTTTHPDGGLNLDSYAGTSFRVVNFATGATAYTGTIAKRRAKTYDESDHPDFANNYTKADVWECDFSALTTPGEYVVVVDRIGRSFPFEIGNQAVKEPFYYAMKGLFWQRQGVWKERYDGQVIPADHTGTWKWDPQWNPGDDHSLDGFSISRAVDVDGLYGYYFDAGDWDGYIRHNYVVLSLLLLYDLTPDRFTDGEVGNRYKRNESDAWIDEGSNGLPDLLDEASWLVNYQRRARNLLQNNYGGTGGVPGYSGRDGVPNGNGVTAWDDTREWYLGAEDPEMTFFYAGNAAYYATCLNEFHQLTGAGTHPEAAGWIAEARAAYTWAVTNATSGGTGRQDAVDRAKGYAAAALYRATGEAGFQTDFKNYFEWEPTKGYGEWSNPNVADVAASIFAQIPDGFVGLDATLKTTCVDYVVATADNNKVVPILENGYRQPIERGQFAALGGVTTPRVTLLPVAYQLTGDAKYLDAVHHAASYVLGGNQMNMVFISGLGERDDDYIFSPNAYLTSDYNSKVYSPESYIGHTSYYSATHNTGYWFYGSINSEFDSQLDAVPSLQDIGKWPGTERKTYNRFSIQGGEFTVNQQNNYMIYAHGTVKALANPTGGANYRLHDRPTVSLNLTDGQDVSKSQQVLSVSASSDVRYVDYYYEWHYIGRSADKANDFQLTWNPLLPVGTNNVLITAVAYDDKGRISLPSPQGDKTVNIVAEPDPDSEAPSKPVLTASSTTQTTTELAWNPATDNVAVTSYQLFQDGTKITDLPASQTTYTASGLVASTTYAFVLEAHDAATNSNSSEALSITTLAPDATTFTITASTDGNGTISPQGKITVAQDQDQHFTITAREGYQFTDLLVDGSSQGVMSSYTFQKVTQDHTISASFELIPDNEAPTAPVVANPQQDGNTVTLTWSAASDNQAVATYTIEHNGQRIATQGADTLSFTLLNLPPGEHTFTITALDAAGNSSPASQAVSVSVPPASPSNSTDTQAPEAFELTAKANTQGLTLTWNTPKDNYGIVRYILYQNKQPSDTLEASATTYVLSELSADSTYTFTLVAYDAAGNATEASYTVEAGTVVNPTPTKPTPEPPLTQNPTVAPPLFTPNDDGQNDAWQITLPPEEQLVSLKVYDQFGRVVFTATDSQTAWDGTFRGKLLPKGAYYYSIITANTNTNVPQTATGSVALIR